MYSNEMDDNTLILLGFSSIYIFIYKMFKLLLSPKKDEEM